MTGPTVLMLLEKSLHKNAAVSSKYVVLDIFLAEGSIELMEFVMDFNVLRCKEV